MKINRLLIAFAIIGLTIYVSCRKMDRINQEPVSKTDIRTKFFTIPSTTNPLVKSIVESIKRQDGNRDFIPRLIKKAGYAIWDKAIISATINGVGITTETATEGQTVIIPFVLENGNTTNASLIVNTIQSDTTFRLIFGSQYSQFGFAPAGDSSWDAKDIFHLFTKFDNEIFGHRSFKIIDGRLFPPGLGVDSNKNAVLKYKDEQRGLVTNVVNAYTFCNTYDICFATPEEYEQICGGECTTGCQFWTGEEEVCTTVYIESGGGGGTGGGGSGGGSGGGGGSNGGGGNWEETLCIDDTSTPEDECLQGWVPDPNPNPPLTDPIDTLLKKYALLSNKYSDSLGNLCETEHKERFFNIVGYNNQLDTFRVLTGQSDDEIKSNYNMIGGRVLLGSWHYHPKYSDGTPGSWPSGGDVAQLYDKPKDFIMIINSVNARYALVVENVSLMSTWKNIMGNGPKLFPEKVYQSVLADPRVYTTGPTYIQMTKEKLILALGASSVNGIGLYEASSKNGTSFTKIN